MSVIDVSRGIISLNEDELKERFNRDTHDPPNLSIFDDIEIKHEEVDFNHEGNSDLETSMDSNIPHVDSRPDTAANDILLDLNRCERDCQTCQKLLMMLSEHVRATHAGPQSIQDSLLIDPLTFNLDPPQPLPQQSSSIQIKTEIDETIENLDHSEPEKESKSESDTDHEFEIGSERDPDYSPSTSLARSQPAKKRGSRDSKTSKKAKMGVPPPMKQWKCTQCGKCFNQKVTLKTHMKIHTEKSFRCETCAKTFTHKGNFNAHMRTHTGEKPYKCTVCDKCFKRLDHLTEHGRIHTGEKPFKCTVCERRFMHSGELVKHKRSHTGEKPYVCTVCEKSFARSGVLRRHQKIHTGEKPYRCDECDKSFAEREHLTRHQRTHTGERPHWCDGCERSFTRLDHLMKHKRLHCGDNVDV